MRTTRSSALPRSPISTTALPGEHDSSIPVAPEMPAPSSHSKGRQNRLSGAKMVHNATTPATGVPEPVTYSDQPERLQKPQQKQRNDMKVAAASTVRSANKNGVSKVVKTLTKKKEKKLPSADQRKVSVTTSKVKDPGYFTVSSESDCKSFFSIVNSKDAHIADFHTIEIHLNGGQYSDYYDDYLAMALNAFHPHPDGTNPHKLECLKLVISSNVLFTRYNYTLVSPAVSYDVKNNLHRLMMGTMTKEEKDNLAFKVNSTEKSIAKSLLGIRGVKSIMIESSSRSKMEATFADTIKSTLTLPPGVDLVSSNVPSSIPTLDHDGVLLSQKMRAQELSGKRPYPLHKYITPDSECGNPRVLVDETTQIMGDYLDEGEENTKIKTIAAAKRGSKRKVSQEDNQMTQATTAAFGSIPSISARSLRSYKRIKSNPGNTGKESGANSDASPVVSRQPCESGPKYKMVEDLVRIMAKPQDGEDLILPKHCTAPNFINQRPRVKGTRNGEWLVLTGKGGMAQMGWRT